MLVVINMRMNWSFHQNFYRNDSTHLVGSDASMSTRQIQNRPRDWQLEINQIRHTTQTQDTDDSSSTRAQKAGKSALLENINQPQTNHHDELTQASSSTSKRNAEQSMISQFLSLSHLIPRTTNGNKANRSNVMLPRINLRRSLKERPRVGSFIPPELIAQLRHTHHEQNQSTPRRGPNNEPFFLPPEKLIWITEPTTVTNNMNQSLTFLSTPFLPLLFHPTPENKTVHTKRLIDKMNNKRGTQTTSTTKQVLPPPPALPGPGVMAEQKRIVKALQQANRTLLAKIFEKCFANTLETTVSFIPNQQHLSSPNHTNNDQHDDLVLPYRAYVITGDINLMWLRDSSAQVHPYLLLPSLHKDPTIQAVIEGTIAQQVWFIRYSPYGSSFRLDYRPNPPSDDGPTSKHLVKARNVFVSMHNYELDSLCYPLWLSYEWWNRTGRTHHILTQEWVDAAWLILDVFHREQRHFLSSDQSTDISEKTIETNATTAEANRTSRKATQIGGDCRDWDTSCYRYLELAGEQHEGPPVAYTGMIWSAFRPSDDKQEYGYLVPANGMCVVVLEYLAEMAEQILYLPEMVSQARQIQSDILQGMSNHAIFETGSSSILAYEVDGLGAANFMDDANIPSLLSLEYFGFADIAHKRYPLSRRKGSGTEAATWHHVVQGTRNMVWSSSNEYFYKGGFARGIGSPHTPKGWIWHMSIVMRALTLSEQDVFQNTHDNLVTNISVNATSETHLRDGYDGSQSTPSKYDTELESLFDMLIDTTAGTGFMHESFNPYNPRRYTRSWFAWSNSLLAELVLERLPWLTEHPERVFKKEARGPPDPAKSFVDRQMVRQETVESQGARNCANGTQNSLCKPTKVTLKKH